VFDAQQFQHSFGIVKNVVESLNSLSVHFFI